MLMYGWMKFVEVAPERYDWAVKLMTAGRLDLMKDCIAECVKPGDRVLDIGCGTGTLALRLLRRGAFVTGIDISAFMLETARKKAQEAGVDDRLALIKDSVTQLRKHATPSSFDCIVCTLVLGELSPDYVAFIFDECLSLLAPGGQLMIGDEVWPQNRLTSVMFRAMLAIAWIPQFLLLRRVNYPVRNLPGIIAQAGFRVEKIKSFLFTSLNLIYATKPTAIENEASLSPPATFQAAATGTPAAIGTH